MIGYKGHVRPLLEALKREPMRAATVLLVVVVAFVALVLPFLRATYPPLTDLPFHAAQVSIIRHYWDPSFHFHEQFSIHPLEVPYLTMYAIGVLGAWVLPITWATKLMAICMLALLPLGLAVLFRGLGKNPLWGVAGLGFAWTDLTHWGFLSFVGALGLYAAAIGCALTLLREPTRKRQVVLGAVLLAVFFTHVYRFPFAVLACALAAALTYPATRRVRPLLWPLGVSSGVFVLWLALKPSKLAFGGTQLELNTSRTGRFGEFLFGNYMGSAGETERVLAWLLLAALVAAAVLAWVYRDARDDTERAWRRGTTLLVALLAAGHLLAYFVLPARIGEWWYVYPRELPAAAFLATALLPDLPSRQGVKLAAVALVGLASARMGLFVAGRFAEFERDSADFRRVIAELPKAPKVAYLVIDHLPATPSTGPKRHSAYVHFPAWVQAERGGWLSFHFAGWGLFPVRYRSGSADVPPPVPRDWEWNPSWFRVEREGLFFDWFLVRLRDDPAPIFAADPRIQPVSHSGTWWLYRKR